MAIQASSKKPEEFLKKDELHFLLAKIKEIKVINEHIQPLLDHSLRESCQVANINQKQLVILAKNASIATTLRFNKGILLAKFREDPILKKFTDIHCIVRLHQRTTHNTTRHEKNKMSLLSTDTAEMMISMAETLTDPKLKEVMIRIASHRQK